jgi:hypothetical protein
MRTESGPSRTYDDVAFAPLSVDKQTSGERAKSGAIDPGCVKTPSQIEIVSGFSETIDATVY